MLTAGFEVVAATVHTLVEKRVWERDLHFITLSNSKTNVVSFPDCHGFEAKDPQQLQHFTLTAMASSLTCSTVTLRVKKS